MYAALYCLFMSFYLNFYIKVRCFRSSCFYFFLFGKVDAGRILEYNVMENFMLTVDQRQKIDYDVRLLLSEYIGIVDVEDLIDYVAAILRDEESQLKYLQLK